MFLTLTGMANLPPLMMKLALPVPPRQLSPHAGEGKQNKFTLHFDQRSIDSFKIFEVTSLLVRPKDTF